MMGVASSDPSWSTRNTAKANNYFNKARARGVGYAWLRSAVQALYQHKIELATKWFRYALKYGVTVDAYTLINPLG
jgi:hypothetical protein